jgi:enoyl-[acyl-carrier protein] reductase III
MTKKTVLITGGSRGIGRATALEMASQGYNVIIVYKKNEAAAMEVLEEIKKRGSDGIAIPTDMENPEEIRSMFQEVKDKIGHLDALILNAAASAFKPLNKQKEHNMERTFNLTVKGALVAVQEATPLMAGRNGKIVTVSGFDSFKYVPYHGMLGAAKAALESLTRYWACELAGQGITVNSVNPGAIESDSSKTYAGDNWEPWKKEWLAATPKGRMGTPEDIAGVIAFLCSPAAEFICGQTIVVDGGITLTSPPFGQ